MSTGTSNPSTSVADDKNKVKFESETAGQVGATGAEKEDPMARTFSGLPNEDIEEYIDYVDGLSEANGWSESRTASKVKARLLGPAANFVRVLKDVGKPLKQWNTTKTAESDRQETLRYRLLERFGKPITPVELCNMTRDLKKTESETVQDFYYRALRVVQKKQVRLNPEIATGTDDFEKNCENDHFILFVNGLPTEMRERVLGVQAPPERSIECLAACVNIERQLKEEEALRRRIGVLALETRSEREKKEEMASVQRPYARSEKPQSGPNANTGASRGGGRGGRRRNNRGGRNRFQAEGSWYRQMMGQLKGRCFECGSEGHFRADCPRRQNPGTAAPPARAVGFKIRKIKRRRRTNKWTASVF